MFNDPTPRPAEHMHSVRCAASAMLAAVENLRDQEGLTDHEFILEMQDNPWFIARGYLADGTASCLCPPCDRSCCKPPPSDVCDHEPNGWDCSRYTDCPAWSE